MTRARHLTAAILAAFFTTNHAHAAEVTLRAQHFLPATSVLQTEVLEPFATRVAAASDGRIDIEIYPSMQLGGKPPQLFDQARDGIVDIAWTLLGYTPGRFPIAEAVELPFVAGSAYATTLALQDFSDAYLGDELSSVHPLILHVGAPGKFHFKEGPVASLDDLSGVKVRAPSRGMTQALRLLGATPVGMPVPELAQSLRTGVIDGALIPWEVTPSLKLSAITQFHTEFEAPHGLYTSVFALVMNKDRFEALPADLQAVIDQEAAQVMRQIAGRYDAIEADIRARAVENGAQITVIPEDELGPWRAATHPVIDDWRARMKAAGQDGDAMLSMLQSRIAHYETEQ